METVWAILIVMSGSIHTVPGSPGPEGFIDGTIEMRSTMYFESKDTCDDARNKIINDQSRDPSVSIQISDCTAKQLKVENN